MNIKDLQPIEIWENFAKLNAVPRASKKEARVIKFIEDFGHSLNLPTYTDKVGNVIIKKQATKGMENKATIALQSHLDMVHQKIAIPFLTLKPKALKCMWMAIGLKPKVPL